MERGDRHRDIALGGAEPNVTCVERAWFQRLKLRNGELLSSFAFIFVTLRLYVWKKDNPTRRSASDIEEDSAHAAHLLKYALAFRGGKDWKYLLSPETMALHLAGASRSVIEERSRKGIGVGPDTVQRDAKKVRPMHKPQIRMLVLSDRVKKWLMVGPCHDTPCSGSPSQPSFT